MFKIVNLFFLIYPITLGIGLTSFADAGLNVGKGIRESNPLIATCKEQGSNKSLKIKVQNDYGRTPLSFVENDGQLDEKAKFYEKGNGRVIFRRS